MILDIECEWGRDPGWFSTLGVDAQARLLARHRIKLDPQGVHWTARRDR